MARVEAYVKEEIQTISKKDLEKLVIKAASISKEFHDYLLVNYINTANGEQDLFEKVKQDLEVLFRKSYRGYSMELQLANMLAACNKRIKEFAKVCKDKSLEMDLIMLVLEIPFSLTPKCFITCFTRYNHQVYLLVKKAMGILNSKLHEDYYIQYAPKLNEYLEILHKNSAHLDYIYDMPKSIQRK